VSNERQTETATEKPEDVVRLCVCFRCGGETEGSLTCRRCVRKIFEQAVRLGTLTKEEAISYGKQF